MFSTICSVFSAVQNICSQPNLHYGNFFLNSKTHQSKRHRRTTKTAFDVVQRLPLHRSLSQSQQLILSIVPHWQEWLAQRISKHFLSPDCATAVHVSAWQFSNRDNTTQGSLVIHCVNPTQATQIRQNQQHLIDYLTQHCAIFSTKREENRLLLTGIIVRLQQNNEQLPLATQTTSLNSNEPSRRNTVIDEYSLRAINACQKQTRNNALALALQNLSVTLSSLKNQRE